MRNLYTEKRSNADNKRHMMSKLWKMFSLLVVLAFTATIGMSQTAMTWTGAENNRFTNENNWEPAGTPIGNNLTIPMQLDSTLAPFVVEVTGAENISVNILEMGYATEDQYQPKIIINMDNDAVEFNVANGSESGADYGYTGLVIKKGYYKFRKGNGPRMDSDNCWLKVEGGKAEYKNLLMGNANAPVRGGKIYISGGELNATEGFGRMFTGREDGQIEITASGILKVAGNFVAPTANWINGGNDYTVKRNYDAIANYTTYSAVPANFIGIENSDRQVSKTGEVATDTLRLLETGKVLSAKTFAWRYRKTGETTYTNFTGTGANTASFAPTFMSSGTFYVSCLVDGVATENEVEFYIVSNAISFTPAEFPIQFVRLGEMGAEMTAKFTTAPSKMEWKYSTVPGGPYLSFDPVATTATLKPSFTEEGNHYVVIDATISGGNHISTELLYNVEGVSSSSKSITWTGLVSNEGTNPANWSPVANPYRNSIAINAFDSLATTPYPLYSPAGNDTVYTFWVGPGATFTVDIEDTLNIRGGWQQVQGTLDFKKGVITNASYFRMDGEQGKVLMSGNTKMTIESLLMGNSNTPTAGGSFYLTDNAILHTINIPGRICPDTLESVTYISDNAQVEYEGDVRSTVQGWIESLKIVCPAEGWEPSILYDAEMNLTIVRALNTTAFAIENDQKTYTTANYPIDEAVSLKNVDGVTSWEWKWGTNINGPWSSFEPAVKDVPTFNPSFAQSGTYFLVAETSEGVVTTNMKAIVVIDLAITPNDDQFIGTNEDGTSLMTVIPAEFTVTAISWYYRIAGETEYFQTGVADSVYAPNFAERGIYEVFYGVEVQDEFGIQYFLQSSYVTVTAGNVGVDAYAYDQLKLYPNPTTGKFYINGSFENDYSVEVMDLTGRIVSKHFMAAGSHPAIDITGSGIYVVKLRSNNDIKVGRLVVQ
ncbi:MAG: T9SS type A sorting domain-containing protein [Prolixibacteraceae bacterium]